LERKKKKRKISEGLEKSTWQTSPFKGERGEANEGGGPGELKNSRSGGKEGEITWRYGKVVNQKKRSKKFGRIT